MRGSRPALALVVILGALLAAILPGPDGALAGHEESGVQSYSACIKPPTSDWRTSHLFNLTLGNAPSPGCGSFYSQVHLAGGDITAVSAGVGLTGGGTNGAAALGVDFGTGTNQVARGDHNHDARYATRSELGDPGTINNAANPVNWTKLKSVPAGFADGTDDVGTAGQNGTAVYGTAELIVVTNSFTVVPNLTQTVTVPANSVLHISTDGGVMTYSAVTTHFAVVDVAFHIDGTVRPDAGFRRLYTVNSSATAPVIANWSFADSVVLTAGTHTIAVEAKLASGNTNARVSGDSTSVLQGQLSVLILKL